MCLLVLFLTSVSWTTTFKDISYLGCWGYFFLSLLFSKLCSWVFFLKKKKKNYFLFHVPWCFACMYVCLCEGGYQKPWNWSCTGMSHLSLQPQGTGVIKRSNDDSLSVGNTKQCPFLWSIWDFTVFPLNSAVNTAICLSWLFFCSIELGYQN